MNDSFPVFHLFGIEVRLHVLFVYLVAMLLFMGAMSGSVVGTTIAVGMLFTLVLLHELGHSLVARRFGVQVVDIVLWPLGGMARMAEIPEEPRTEGWIAAAGPLTNLALGLPVALLHGLAFGWETLAINPLSRPITSALDVSAMWVWFNGMLGTFNLIPAFPMDGGRLLRAFLAGRAGWLAGTEQAVRVGRFVAWAMILTLFLPRGMNVGCSVPLIGVFVLWAGARELWATRMRHMGTGAGFFEDFFRRARENAGAGPPPGWEPHPGVPPTAGPQRDEPDSQRPTLDVDATAPRHQGSGFSEEDVRRLERFHGRLRRPPHDSDGAE